MNEKRDTLQNARKYAAARRRKQRWLRAVTVMAAVVVFCTTYALILPAITLEKKCEIPEHTHTDACYTQVTGREVKTLACPLEIHTHTEECLDAENHLSCGYADFVVHRHDGVCYDEGGNLWCTLPEIEEHQHEDACFAVPEAHVHDEGCYAREQGELICTESTEPLHRHSEECYAESRELHCEEEHEHTDDCYALQRELTCTESTEPAHVHTDSCYNWTQVLTCGLSTEPGAPVLACGKEEVILHTHELYEDEENPGCYDGDGNLICGMTEVLEHQHTDACYETVTEPVDTQTLTCASTDPEHTHTARCYGTWALSCTMEEHTHSEECMDEETEPSAEETQPTEEERKPVYICGLEEHTHDASCVDESLTRVCGLPEHTHTADCLATPEDETGETVEVAVCMDTVFENDRINAVFHVEGTALLTIPSGGQEETETTEKAVDAIIGEAAETPSEPPTESPTEAPTGEPQAPAQELALTVTELKEDNTDYRRIADASPYEDLLDLLVLKLDASGDDRKLDLSGCTITAQISPTERLMRSVRQTSLLMDSGSETEENKVMMLSALESDGVTEQASTFILPNATEAPVLQASVGSDGIMAVAVLNTPNPHFTVQYYAYLDTVQSSGDAVINTIIDTTGCNLPVNGNNDLASKPVGVKLVGDNLYEIATTKTLEEVYSSNDFEYIKAPNLAYFNRLYENGHYSLSKIWVLKAGSASDSTDSADWNVYDPSTVHFTNRNEAVSDDTVLITDNTVIRLVYGTTKSEYTNAVNFYDYDITDDGLHTAAQGINSASNYTGTGAKLAFGNNNTGTGLSTEVWDGNTLNRSNANGYQGCTFGLAARLVKEAGTEKDIITYASGVDAPKLFDDGPAAGKKSYDNEQYSLNFDRVGDTYTLSSVGGTNTANNLQYFSSRPNWNNTKTIWYNNFWPMDGVYYNDPHTGKTDSPGQYTKTDGTTANYPLSDNGVAHNNLFGMQYAVQFTLTKDYVGPLDYYFFGDDDMWVFLDGKLVCDIGGVHSSVGEYVDLWDYLDKDTDSDTHILKFYYTERGLSGSTCFMRFTLPSVASITPDTNTGNLTVRKTVVGAGNTDEEFHFSIKFTDASGNNLRDDYSYTRYSANNEIIAQDVIIFDGGAFDLKANEYVVINYLPYGTKYSIVETDVPYYDVSYSVDGGASQKGNTASGAIPTGGNSSVVFTNTAKPVLPNTGGAGTTLFTTAGLTLIFGAAVLLYRDHRRRKEDVVSS